MSLRDIRAHVGELLISGFDGLTLPAEMREIAREFDLGGTIIFSRNVEAPAQVAELALATESLRKETPLWFSVDQEGGRVQRLKEPFTRWPPMITLGRAKDAALAARFAKAMAAELLAVGVTLDFAPVLDVLTNAKNPAIGDRALSERVEDVATLGRTLIEALPGRRPGRRRQALSRARRHRRRLAPRSADLRAAAGSAARRRARAVPRRRSPPTSPCMLTCHVLFTEIDDEHPATLSPRIVQAHPEGRARLPGRGDHRRSRHEGDRRPLHHRGDGGALPARRLRRLPDLQRRLRQEGAGARSGDPRGRGRHGRSPSASRTR